ncbi:MAG: acetyl-CoA carboxylase biotin carboxyl carrier protein [Inquilinaceae bacterium]
MAEFDIDGDLIRKLADLLSETGLTEVEFAEGDRRIRVTRQGRAVAAEVSVPAAPAAPASPTPAPTAGPAAGAVPSPMVGTAYLSPEPGAPAFVKVGDQVTEGQTLMIVEAMKVMNPIRAPRSGRVKQIMVSDSQPVEFGETLMVVE